MPLSRLYAVFADIVMWAYKCMYFILLQLLQFVLYVVITPNSLLVGF